MTDRRTEVETASLEDVEGVSWGDPPPGSSRLIATVHALRRRPIAELGVEDLRVLIAQHVGLGVLLPRAVAVIEADPLAEGDFYPGDLLVAVLRAPGVDAQLRARLAEAVARIDPADLGELDHGTRVEIDEFWRAERARVSRDGRS